MCFTQEMSGFFALSSIFLAIHAYYKYESSRVALAILYFGSMEILQFFQYFFVAHPEDDYAMCGDSTNQFLTVVGYLHICFQPYFCSMANCRFRYSSIKNRHEKDLMAKLCFVGGLWMASSYLYGVILYPDDPNLAPKATMDCPNYEPMGDGYDPYLKQDTPNLPGHSCTYIPHSTTKHLAWVVPRYQPTYFSPGLCLHTFLMFCPMLFIGNKPWLSLVFFLTGPGLAVALTASLNEQAAIWCYFSICQIFLLVFFMPDPRKVDTPMERVVHEGSYGEERLEYHLVKTTNDASKNGYQHSANGKKIA